MKTKRCSKCGKVKSVSEFSKHKTQKDGLSGWCKECHKEYQKEYDYKIELVEGREVIRFKFIKSLKP